MRIYTLDGEIIEEDGPSHLFRKITKSKREITICKIIQEYPHENIVKIYEIYEAGMGHSEPSYIDMEFLDVDVGKFRIQEMRQIMQKVKDYLQSIGIMYIDWKPDNMGINRQGNLVLFDFDVSGLVDKKGEWELEPSLLMYNYRKAMQRSERKPKEIDDYLFEEEW